MLIANRTDVARRHHWGFFLTVQVENPEASFFADLIVLPFCL
jgi:hypothetical protein